MALYAWTVPPQITLEDRVVSCLSPVEEPSVSDVKGVEPDPILSPPAGQFQDYWTTTALTAIPDSESRRCAAPNEVGAADAERVPTRRDGVSTI